MSQSCFAEVFNESEKKDNRYEHGPAQGEESANTG